MPAHLVHMKVENVTHAYCGAKDPGPAHVKHALLFFLKCFIISSHFSIWSCLLVNDATFSLSHFIDILAVLLVPPPTGKRQSCFSSYFSSSFSSSRHKTAARSNREKEHERSQKNPVVLSFKKNVWPFWNPKLNFFYEPAKIWIFLNSFEQTLLKLYKKRTNNNNNNNST